LSGKIGKKGEAMASTSYKARLFIVSGEQSLYRDTPINAFSVAGGTAKAVDLNATNDTNLLFALEQAKSRKNITLAKMPSDDDFDSILSGLFQAKTKFGLNFDVYASYTGKSWLQIVHFFGEDASIGSQPNRVGAGKSLSLKVEFSYPKADFKQGVQKEGKWIEDDDWIK
jgi:hypothetical protein